MPISVTLAVDPVTASVRLTVAGGLPPYAAVASPGGGRDDYPVRTTWSQVLGDPTARVGIDGSAPLNTPVQYVVTDAAGAQATSPAVTAAADAPILSDATDPGRTVSVRVVSQRPNAWEARSVWFDILGASAPFASVAPMRFRSGDLVLRCPDRNARAALIDLMRPGNPLLLRATCPDAVDDLTILVESVDESLILDDDPTGPTLLTITYQAISPDLGPYAEAASRSYATLLATIPSYGDVLTTYATYDALRVGDANAGLGPDLIGNGSFSAGMAGWNTFWTAPGVTFDASGGTGRATNGTAAPVSVTLQPDTMRDSVPTTPGARYRITGRVRCSSPAASVFVHWLTHTAPGVPAYFQPGVSQVTLPVTAGAAWAPFTVDAVVPAGHDVASVIFRVDGLPADALVEWDDLTCRERVG